jgi:hypothetical protein
MATIKTGPESLDWEAYLGDRNRAVVALPSEGDPVDITGAVLEAQVRASASDGVVGATATITEDDYTLGSMVVEWDGEALRALVGEGEVWTGVWDLQVTEVGETLPRTVYRGTFRITHDVTRAGAVD